MAPSEPADPSHVYISLLKCIRSLDVDWDQFATEVGIKAKGNAQRKLKGALKKDGLQLSGGSITILDAETSTPKTKGVGRPKKSEKRKKDDEDNENDEEAAPSKKKPTKAKAGNAGDVVC